MKYKAGDFEASHSSPIWRNRANLIFAAYLGSEGSQKKWEQLWGQQTRDSHAIVCCIPFFARNVALGDEVKIDEELVMQKVVRESGNETYRVWFGKKPQFSREKVIARLSDMDVLMEWSSENLVALSVSGERSQDLADYLQIGEEKNLLVYETGKA